ncbi:hypothetical protein BS47DRAFT_1354827, partial [Hydnum rufescens UP504]
MVGQPESIARKEVKASIACNQEKKDLLEAYKAEVEKASLAGTPKPSIRAFTQKHGKGYLYSTITRLYNGGTTQCDSNAQNKAHLTELQEELLCEFIMSMADRGFPLTHELMEKYALKMIHINKHHITQLGKRWLDRFLTQHGDRISMKWGASLDTVRANAVNPTTITGWFTLASMRQVSPLAKVSHC